MCRTSDSVLKLVVMQESQCIPGDWGWKSIYIFISISISDLYLVFVFTSSPYQNLQTLCHSRIFITPSTQSFIETYNFQLKFYLFRIILNYFDSPLAELQEDILACVSFNNTSPSSPQRLPQLASSFHSQSVIAETIATISGDLIPFPGNHF